MPLVTTDLLIGSVPNLQAQSLTVTTAGPFAEAVVVPAGNYYLYDDQTPLDLALAVAAAITSHSVISSASVEVQLNMRLRITANVAFTLTWPVDGVLRDLLGFTGNLSPISATHTAPNISPLLWSAGRTATYEARLGRDGIPVRDTAVGQSGTGVVRATTHNTYRRNTMTWHYVENSRVWATESGGEFFAFYQSVLGEMHRFKVWRAVPEDSASSLTMDISGDSAGVLPSSGAYVYAPPSQPMEMPWGREFGFTETLHPILIPVVSTTEYGT